jgi:chromosome segregation ATPase
MKNFHQNLLIILALCLCALCVYQWNTQTRQRQQMTSLNQKLNDKIAAIQEYTNHIANMDSQIAQMDKRITELKDTIKTNEAVQLDQRREISRLRVENEALTNDVAQYKEAVGKLEGKLKEAYEGIKKQNEAIKELAAQRDGFVQKLNDSIKDRNEIVNKYNDLVKSLEKPPSK